MTLVYTVLFNARVPRVKGQILQGGVIHERMALRPGLDDLPYKLYDDAHGSHEYPPQFPFPVVYRHAGYKGPFATVLDRHDNLWAHSCRSSMYPRFGHINFDNTADAIDFLLTWTGRLCR